jgi:hypothetical protein
MSLIPQWMAKSSEDADEFEYDMRNGQDEEEDE